MNASSHLKADTLNGIFAKQGWDRLGLEAFGSADPATVIISFVDDDGPSCVEVPTASFFGYLKAKIGQNGLYPALIKKLGVTLAARPVQTLCQQGDLGLQIPHQTNPIGIRS